MNGERVSTHELGAFTTYAVRVLYDAIDITAALQKNEGGPIHSLAVSLGDGWYSQGSVRVGVPSLLLKCSIRHSGGESVAVISRLSGWSTSFGPVIYNDIYNGETYDARLETPGWTLPGYKPADPHAWEAAVTVAPPGSNVTISSHAVMPVIRIGESYTPCDMWETGPGEYVFDFCQNMAGFTTLRVPAVLNDVAGVNITQLHAECIHGPHGTIFHHYSNTKEIVTYTTRGDGAAITYTPLFTYMVSDVGCAPKGRCCDVVCDDLLLSDGLLQGFRYVRLTGYPGVPDHKTLTAHFVHTVGCGRDCMCSL